jgi:hypothetical protein
MANEGHIVSTGWPSFRYGPGGEAKIFQCEADVPKGWKDNPSAFDTEVAGKPAPIEASAGLPLSRNDIIKALNQRKAKFNPKGSTQMLYDKLSELVEAE